MDRVRFRRAFHILIFFSFFFPDKVISNHANSSSSNALCIEIERDALLKFKTELEDPSNNLSSWIPATDCCKWYGIHCNTFTGHVEKLQLANTHDQWSSSKEEQISYIKSKLKGKLSDSILNLKHLCHIDLSHNDFNYTKIPSFLGSFVSLNYLNLSHSRFHGSIPHQLGNLSNLQRLDLGSDYGSRDRLHLYSENLQWIQGLRSLVSLDLSHTDLSKVSDWLLNVNELPLLVELRLSYCDLNQSSQVSHINFTSLSILDISLNNFYSHIPRWILTLGNLVSLDISQNRFLGSLPEGISNLTSLETLNLSWNDFEGPIPCVIQNLSSLTNLDLSLSNFNSTSIPSCLYSLHSLKHLDLSSLGLRGEISNDIANLTNLVSLKLDDNKLEGNMPRSMGSFCNLQYIDLSKNTFDLFEIIPEGCLGSNLIHLDLSRNNISGHFPNHIAKMKNLQYIDLSYNFISGPVPEFLGNLSLLIHLDLHDNKFNGTLPKSMGLLSNLLYLSISQNCLEGIVSDVHFANLISLKELDLSQNNLTLSFSPGWIPPFQLVKLFLSSCNLGPQFPKWLESQRSLVYFDLFNANISDIVPYWFWKLFPGLSHDQLLLSELDDPYAREATILLGSNKLYGNLPRISSNVVKLDLSNNLFSGNMSHFLCYPRKQNNQLNILNLGGNLLSGNIPNCWTNWMSLTFVTLSGNMLSGNLPSSIGSLSNLQTLHLRNNNLSGKIPRLFEKSSELMVLDLSLNAFEGSIPTWIGMDFSNLVVLGLRSNQLGGTIPHELCQLLSLQIMDIGNNNLIGSIPNCFGNFTAMASKRLSRYLSNTHASFTDNAYVVTKGKEFEYDQILGLMTSMDLSDNNLSGEIPHEIINLLELKSLNLSGNHLTGSIPQQIGSIKSMESLDFSRNQLTGQIPQSIAALTFLSHLNLSYNNLSGQIPSSTQIQSLDPSSFIGNELCGKPLTSSCQRGNKTSEPKLEEGDESYIDKWFYLSVAMGFMVGFWGFWGPLFISRAWRHKFFTFLNSISN